MKNLIQKGSCVTPFEWDFMQLQSFYSDLDLCFSSPQPLFRNHLTQHLKNTLKNIKIYRERSLK